MPAAYKLDTLPPPADPNVHLIEHAARRMAVLKISGFAGEDRMAAKKRELLAKVAAAGLSPIGASSFAFFDPPWTVPFLRRN